MQPSLVLSILCSGKSLVGVSGGVLVVFLSVPSKKCLVDKYFSHTVGEREGENSF